MGTDDWVSLGRELHDKHAKRIVAEWHALLDSEPDENKLQDFLEQYPAFLPGARGDIGNGGHHGPLYGAVIRQAPLQGLDTDRKPDFMWITRSTDLITPICIEIEKPSKRWFRQDGTQHAQFTQAQNQLSQWRSWFDSAVNVAWFRQTYLDGEFARCKLEPQFVLVHGRQKEFDDSSVKTPPAERMGVRRSWARDREHLRTFDSLRYDHDLDSEVSMTQRADGSREVWKIPPTYTVSKYPRGPMLLGDPTNAIDRSVDETKARRPSIVASWREQTEEGNRLKAGKTHRPIAGMSPWGDA